MARSAFIFWHFWTGLVALVFLAGWFRGYRRRHLLENIRDLDELRAMRWSDFELLVGEYYRRGGYRVIERGGGGADGGVDLELRRDGETLLVQCKRWRERAVKVQPVRELWGVVSHEGATGAVFVASGRFTADALAFARGKRYQLIDGEHLLQLVAVVRKGALAQTAPEPAVPQPVQAPASAPALAPVPAPACPRCDSEMVRRPGVGGRPDFWGCARFPSCRGLVPIAAGD